MTPLTEDEATAFRRRALDAIDVLPSLGAFFKLDYLVRQSLCAAIFEGDFRDADGVISDLCAAGRIETLRCASLTELALPSFRFPAVHEPLRRVREHYHMPSYVISDDRFEIMIVSDSDYYWGVATSAGRLSDIAGHLEHLRQNAEDIAPFLESTDAHDTRIGAMLQGFHEICDLSCRAGAR